MILRRNCWTKLDFFFRCEPNIKVLLLFLKQTILPPSYITFLSWKLFYWVLSVKKMESCHSRKLIFTVKLDWYFSQFSHISIMLSETIVYHIMLSETIFFQFHRDFWCGVIVLNSCYLPVLGIHLFRAYVEFDFYSVKWAHLTMLLIEFFHLEILSICNIRVPNWVVKI